jgi:hypothetical protein
VSVSEGGERIDSRLCPENHTATMAPVAAIGSSERDIFLPPKTETPAAAIATGHLEMHAVDEHAVSRRPR